MTNNPDWTRWIYSSLTEHFQSFSLPLFVQNQTRPTNINNFLELRINGPHYNQVTQNQWDIDIFVAGLVTIINDETDIFKIQRLSGELFTLFNKDIAIYRYGDGPNDDNSMLTCLKLSPLNHEKIRTTIYGQTIAATKITQASIEAHYITSLMFTEILYHGSD